MSQHPIDLLPESIRTRSHAHVRTGRYLVATLTVAIMLSFLATWSHLALEHAKVRLADAERSAAAVMALESQALDLRAVLGESRTYIDQYNEVSLPFQLSSLLATVVNELPDSVTLDQVTVDAGHRRGARSPRSKVTGEGGPPPRILTGEIAGFAANDGDVAELVERLASLSPLEKVNLDYSRTRIVRDRAAREFRLSFRVDLDQEYDVAVADALGQDERFVGVTGEETGHGHP